MKTKQQIIKVHLGDGFIKKSDPKLVTGILVCMEEWKSQTDWKPEDYKVDDDEIPTIGIVVDGSTTNGNPGDTEYQGWDIEKKEMIFGYSIGKTTNNVNFFLLKDRLYKLDSTVHSTYQAILFPSAENAGLVVNKNSAYIAII